MENQTLPTNPPKEKKSRDLIYIVIIILLTGTCGILSYFLSQQKTQIEIITVEKEKVTSERESLKVELNDMLVQYEGMKTNNAELNSKLEEQETKIKELMLQAEKHKDDAYIIKKLKKETETLRVIMQGFVQTIDSLNTLNIVLREEKKGVEKELGTQKEKFTSLEKEKENLAGQVKIGSRLRTKSISATPQKVKSNNEHRETNRAKNTDVVRCCMMLDKNEIAKPGMKDIFMRVITPDGKVIADSNDEAHQFSFNGVKGLFSMKKEIDYQNQEMEVCMYLEIKSDIPAGEYIVEVYSDEAEIGRTGFKLK